MHPLAPDPPEDGAGEHHDHEDDRPDDGGGRHGVGAEPVRELRFRDAEVPEEVVLIAATAPRNDRIAARTRNHS